MMTSPNTATFQHPFDSKLVQAREIVKELSLTKKIQLLSGHDMWTLKSIESHGIPSICITDGPHGLRKQLHSDSVTLLEGRVDATCFPTASCLSCSWDVSLIETIGKALGQECRHHNVAVLLGPGLNIKRHACGGRNFEYYSEDPYLSGMLAASLVRGIQSQNVGACPKHVCVNNQEYKRMRINVLVDERTLREVYLRGFEIVVKQASPYSLMTAYNQLNGEFCSEHERLWNDIIREEWGHKGVVLTDWGATNNRVRAIQAGVDLEMPGSHGAFDEQVEAAIKSGKLSESALDECVTRNVCLSLLGQDMVAQSHGVTADLDTHHELARKAAMESAVLLKNDDNVLPLPRNASIAVFGDLAESPRYEGMGSSQVKAYKVDNSLDRFREFTDSITYFPGYSPLSEDILQRADQTDVAIVYVGLPEIFESEGMDRSHIHLPYEHNDLVEAVCSRYSKVVVVLAHGAAVAMPWVERPHSILTGFLAGQAGGSALADLIFGVTSPSGKLTETFPIRVEDQLSHDWFPGEDTVEYREGLNVGYRGFDSGDRPVLFPFGHGLSYSQFEHTNLKAVVVAEPFAVQVTLTLQNIGSVRAAEVVQCYVHDCQSTVYRPFQELKAFDKVWLDPGESKHVKLTLTKDAFSFYDVGIKDWIIESGQFELRIGSSSRDIRLTTTIDINDGQTPSMLARETHPPDTSVLIAPDDQFCRRLGVESLPSPTLELTPFHYNSRLLELEATTLGGYFVRLIRRAAAKGLPEEMQEDDAQLEMVHQVVDNTPLRGLVLFSSGKMTFTDLELLLAILNFAAFHIIVQRLWSVIKKRCSWKRR